MKRLVAGVMVVTMGTTGCWRGGGLDLFQAVVLTAVIVSAVAPPEPRVVVVPPPQEGYVWQPGYWTRENNDWVWVDGGWVPLQASAHYVPTHWEQEQDGSWHLISAQWVPG
jgi:hypothetical protein